VDDLFQRVPQLFEVDLDGDNAPDASEPNSFRREALARFMYNLLTVRTDVWGVLGRVRMLEDDKVIAERAFYLVLDRSRDPVQVVLFSDTPPVP